jgi:hypothetical protein
MRSLFLLVALAACTTTSPEPTPVQAPATEGEAAGDDPGGEAEAPADDAMTEADPAATDPAEGTADTDAAAMVTIAALEGAQGRVHAMMPKDEAMAAVADTLGEPVRMDGAEMVWIGQDGTTCKAMTVTLMGDTVGSVTLADVDCPAGE